MKGVRKPLVAAATRATRWPAASAGIAGSARDTPAMLLQPPADHIARRAGHPLGYLVGPVAGAVDPSA